MIMLLISTMFNWSNMGKFMAVGLTDLLESSGMNG
ncbi:hypothetical protein ELE00_24920, partial [Klebsiella pneumoniae]|nr:hypothetical protein [Klebsiella pneumoniae]